MPGSEKPIQLSHPAQKFDADNTEFLHQGIGFVEIGFFHPWFFPVEIGEHPSN
jgi:hypothetical protein